MRKLAGLAALALVLAASTSAHAQARIDMEVATEQGFAATSIRDWYQLLTDLKVDNLQIRSAKVGDETKIETAGTEAALQYRVLAIVTARNELVVPGGRFGLRDKAGIAKWLKTLREEGPDRAKGGKRPPFGIDAAELVRVHEALAAPLGISTLNATPRDILAKAAKTVKYPLLVDTAAVEPLRHGEPVHVELTEVSTGTALAYAIRGAGLVLVPRLNATRKVELLVREATGAAEVWPVGWTNEKRPVDVLPDMFEMINVEIEDIPLSEALDAIGGRLKLPILFDEYALARRGIDPAKIKVNAPAKRNTYSLLVPQLLRQAKLRSEVRVDEAGKPILWVTTSQPVN